MTTDTAPGVVGATTRQTSTESHISKEILTRSCPNCPGYACPLIQTTGDGRWRCKSCCPFGACFNTLDTNQVLEAVA